MVRKQRSIRVGDDIWYKFQKLILKKKEQGIRTSTSEEVEELIRKEVEAHGGRS